MFRSLLVALLLAPTPIGVAGCCPMPNSCEDLQATFVSPGSSNQFAQIVVEATKISFSAGNSEVAAAPVGGDDLPYSCESGQVIFSFKDERGNLGRGVLFKQASQKFATLLLTMTQQNDEDIFAGQIGANYGSYKLEEKRGKNGNTQSRP